MVIFLGTKDLGNTWDNAIISAPLFGNVIQSKLVEPVFIWQETLSRKINLLLNYIVNLQCWIFQFAFLLQLKKQIEWYILMIYCFLSFKKYPNIHLTSSILWLNWIHIGIIITHEWKQLLHRWIGSYQNTILRGK